MTKDAKHLLAASARLLSLFAEAERQLRICCQNRGRVYVAQLWGKKNKKHLAVLFKHFFCFFLVPHLH